MSPRDHGACARPGSTPTTPNAWSGAALDEDFRYGPDITSQATVDGKEIAVEVVAREPGVVAGIPVALAVFAAQRGAGTVVALRADGDRIGPGEAVLRISGPAPFVLGIERTMLNFLTHLSGIASALARGRTRSRGPGR